MKTLSIIIPVYNERGTIRQVVDRVLASDIGAIRKEIIVVDDCSTDGTREEIRLLEKETGCTAVYHRENKGKGGAIKSGLLHATGDFVLIQDADTEYDPDDYAKLLKPIREKRADIVFGSRNLGNNSVPYSRIYYYGGMAVAATFNFLFKTKFSDINTCYKVFPKSVVPRLLSMPNNDFVFDAVELTYMLAKHGPVVEVPISYVARKKKEGKKLNWRHGAKCVATMARMKLGIHHPIQFYDS